MKKLIFTFGKADKNTRIVGIVALALAALAIILLVVSANRVINGPITDIAIIKTVLSEDDLAEVENTFEEAIEAVETAIDEADDDTLEEFEEAFGMPAEKVIEKLEIPSLKNLQILSKSMDTKSADVDEAVAAVFSGIVTGINGYATLLAILVAISAIFMNKGWFITSVVLSALFFFVLAGPVWFFVFLALCIAYCILVSKVKNAYLVYKLAPKVAAQAAAQAAAAAPAAEQTVSEEQNV